MDKPLYDKKTFEKAIKIILAKSEKPKEEFLSSSLIRYNEVADNLDVLGCAQTINELKIYFDGSEVKKRSITMEMMFVRALRVITEIYSYHNGDQKDKHWDNASKILKSINISEDNERFRDLRIYFQGTI